MRTELKALLESIEETIIAAIGTPAFESHIREQVRRLLPLLEAGKEMYLFTRQGYPSCSAVPKYKAALREAMKDWTCELCGKGRHECLCAG